MKKTNILQKTDQTASADVILNLPAPEAQAVFNRLSSDGQLNVVLSVSWTTRQKLIMLSENPEQLVQALPEEEAYWTVKETGLEDALPVISRMSFEQLQYSMDIDCWTKDLIDMAAVMRWLKMLLRCREDHVLEWINRTDEHFLNFAFKKLFNLFRLNEDYDLAEASDLLPSWTIDGLYYFQFAGEEARLVSIPFLHLLYKTDSRYFYYLMENTRWASALELEEDVLRMRQRRMAEQGFPGLDEAGHVYSPMSDREMKVLQEHATRAPAETESAPSTQPRLRYRFSMEGGDLFAYAALRHIREQRSAEKIQKELINLANTVMIADCVEVREHADKQAAFKKVMGYVSIGLEQASRHDAEGAVRLLEELPVLVLFRAGYSRALDLQSRARSICRELKSIHPRLQPDFFGMPLDDVIAGLSGKRPLYYTGYEEADNSLHREFEKIEDIDDMNRALDEASVIKKVLFDCFALGAPGALEDLTTRSALEDAGDLRALQLFNTALVRHVLYGITGTAPVNASELRQFLSMVLTAGTHAQTVSGRISEALLADTVDWLRRQYRMLEEDVTALKSFVRSCLGRLEEECGALAGADEIEPRYISAVLLLR